MADVAIKDKTVAVLALDDKVLFSDTSDSGATKNAIGVPVLTTAQTTAGGINVPALTSGNVLLDANANPLASWQVGLVATRCGLGGARLATAYLNQCTYHNARTLISSVKVVDSACYVTGGVETAVGGSYTITRTIEYPIGSTPQRLLYGGATSGTCPDGGLVTSDELKLAVPIQSGAKFLLHAYVSGATAVPWSAGGASAGSSQWTAIGESLSFSDTVLSDLTGAAGAGFTPLVYDYAFFPAAIVGVTDKPTVGIIGDSRAYGAGEYGSSLAVPYVGTHTRPIAARYAYINMGSSGSTIDGWATNTFTVRAQLLAYCTHIVGNAGINDIVGGATAATMLTSLRALCVRLGNKPVFWSTIVPRGTNADGTGVHSSNTVRTAFNTMLVNDFKELAGVIDINSVLDDGTGQYIQTPAGLTLDGIHESIAGNKYLAAAPIWSAIEHLTR